MDKYIPGTGWREEFVNGSQLQELRLFQHMAEAMNKRQEQLRRREHRPKPLRGFQAKTHAGIAYARFHVRDDIPGELQQGIFRPGKTYTAAVRLSRSFGTIEHDQIPSLHSIAVRIFADSDGKQDSAAILDSDGSEIIQDFLTTSAPVSHTRDAREFMIFARADQSRINIVKFFRMFIRNPGLANRAAKSRKEFLKRPVNSLAAETYWGRLPFAVGEVAVKFRLVPQVPAESGQAARSGFNSLRAELEDRLRIGDVTFRFEVQRFSDRRSTPIEDATVPWPTRWEPLAALQIPQCDLASAESLRIEMAVEALEFNPWHSPDANAFRPLGSLNRARRLVYDASADFRKGRRSQELIPWWKHLIAFRVLAPPARLLNRLWPWHEIARWWRTGGLTNLSFIREHVRQNNLHDVPMADDQLQTRPRMRTISSDALRVREADGTNNDVTNPDMGSAGRVFTRNIPLHSAIPSAAAGLAPSPREISRKLMTRTEFLPIPHLNLYALAWIQFQVHGWFNHERIKPVDATPGDLVKLPLHAKDEWPGSRHGGRQDPMTIIRTPPYSGAHLGPRGMPVYRNTETSWWDGSQLYGSSLARQRLLRETRGSRPGARLRLTQGLLPEDPDTISATPPNAGVDLTGFNDNYWMGLSLLHTLFAREHNAICDALKDAYPGMNNESRFQCARLVIAALMAKIHTVEWTPAILDKPVMELSFDTYWWGLAGQNVGWYMKDLATHEVMHGLPGSDTYHQGVPYAMTEEFVSVYRMHPLLPDEFRFSDLADNPLATLDLQGVTGEFTRPALAQIGFENALYTFGLRNPGAITLFNYPRALQEHRRIKRPNEPEEVIDVATLDIYRDRERGIPRYNDFREQLGLPRVRSFEELASRYPGWAKPIRDIYPGGVDTVDAMVGMFAETPPHEGFGFSETAFRVFIVMAARRQLSDRFFTTHYRPEIYTELGMEWIQRTSFKNMLLRHYPRLADRLQKVDRIFAPWN